MRSLPFDHPWLALFVLMFAFIFGLTVGADIGIVPTRFFGIAYSDKAGHFVLYGTLAAVLHLALRRRTVYAGFVAIPAAFLIAATLAMADEGQKMFMPHRAFDLADLAADATGIAVFLMSLEMGYFRLLTGAQSELE